MAKPQLRHIALFARDPEKVAKFYESVFGMEIVHRNPASNSHFLTDGYMSLAVLAHSVQKEAAVGLNHIGFMVEDQDEMARRLSDAGVEVPKRRPDDRPYAETRACDPEGNMFDLSVHGFERVETNVDRGARVTAGR
jgi:catechol 2,3-dioxygenase-like lactoylglutathione lyase family enzyme